MGCRHHACTQITVSNTLLIPDSKPDIERIIRVTSNPVITKSVVIDHKIIFSGCIDVFVEYVGCVCGHTQPVHFSSFKIPFNHFIDSRSARATQEASLSASIEFQEFQTANRRHVAALIILKICLLKLEKTKCRTLASTCPAQFISTEQIHQTGFCAATSPINDTVCSKTCSCVTCTSPSSTCHDNSICCDIKVRNPYKSP